MIGVGAKLNERFNLEDELGQGGMGSVFHEIVPPDRAGIPVRIGRP